MHESSTSTEILKDFEINNCRVCFDIHDWKRKAQKNAFEGKVLNGQGMGKVAAGMAIPGTIVFTADTTSSTITEFEPTPEDYKACPPDATELGRSTWTLLHTMSAYYPDRPSPSQQSDMSNFLSLFSRLYPCSYCASHLREEMKKEPPVVGSRSALAQWMCRVHNEVNERLGKPLFDCKKIDERWRDGPPDGYC